MRTFRYGVALTVLGGLLCGCSQEPTFQGTALDPPRVSRDFTLSDQFGARVRLSELRGRVVVLTFLYTSCPDLCPLIAGKLRKTVGTLGDLAPQVALLVVTVDPERDTRDRVYAYSEQQGMLDHWHFLTGEAEELQPIWKDYWVGKVWKDDKGEVMHQSPVHLIDQVGKIRVVHGRAFRPTELAHDITALLRG